MVCMTVKLFVHRKICNKRAKSRKGAVVFDEQVEICSLVLKRELKLAFNIIVLGVRLVVKYKDCLIFELIET